MGSKACLRDQAPIKTADTKAKVSLPGWQYFMCIATHFCQKKSALSMIPLGKDDWKLQASNFPWLCPVSLSLAEFNCYLFVVINCDREDNSFWGVLWAFPASYCSWGWSWGFPDFVKGPNEDGPGLWPLRAPYQGPLSMLLFARFHHPFPHCAKVLLNVHLGFSLQWAFPKGLKRAAWGGQ